MTHGKMLNLIDIMERIDMSLWNNLRTKLDETKERIRELEIAEEAIEDIINSVYDLNLPEGIHLVSNIEDDLNITLKAIREELQSLKDKVNNL